VSHLTDNLRFVLFAGTCLLPILSLSSCHGTEAPGGVYRCDPLWTGPTISVPGGVLPLPVGYALRDQTSYPHEFSNHKFVSMSEAWGSIYAGYAPTYWESSVIDPDEVELNESVWRGVSRKTLKFPSLNATSELFLFGDGFVLQFQGAAVEMAEPVASCYLQRSAHSAGEAHTESPSGPTGDTL
jgi:hypothetical protein